ncbi:MAG TPA: 50S ribosomal protein L18 [Candidatus Woesebacteria bacterium]|nr:50S ribosomal protein L18 [Candidatus Woesebacteria bacterium]
MIHDQKLRRLKRIRNKIAINIGIPRLSVFRSNQHIWAQIIDDKHGKTLASFSTKKLTDKKGTKTELATKVGETIAKIALENKVKKVRFDRGIYKYHGRVKALADAARTGGLEF